MQLLRKFVDVKQHRSHHLEKLSSVFCGPTLHHFHHGVQHGRQGGMLIANDVKASFFHKALAFLALGHQRLIDQSVQFAVNFKFRK